jgi:hypothetical protein
MLCDPALVVNSPEMAAVSPKNRRSTTAASAPILSPCSHSRRHHTKSTSGATRKTFGMGLEYVASPRSTAAAMSVHRPESTSPDPGRTSLYNHRK